MSKYTVKGSAGLDARIDADLARIVEVAEPYSSAGILLGGYGRGEGTPYILPDGSQAPFNDYDLVVIVDRLDSNTRQLFEALAQQLTKELGIPVDLYPYRMHDLPKCEFSLLNYEMKYGHKVAWGNEHILDAMPSYPHGAVPLSEGSRLLLNRGKLLLDIKQRLSRSESLSKEEHIRFIKFIYKVWLALGDCALLVEGKYDISYAVKNERIASIGDIPDREAIIQGFQKAVDLKEWGDYQRYSDVKIELAYGQACEVFLRLFPWYRQQYSGMECSVFKAMLLNLKWNHWPYVEHPRVRLYDALTELLKNQPDMIQLGQILSCNHEFEERFYKLQARFS